MSDDELVLEEKDVYDVDRVKKFVKHLFLASKKAEERKEAKDKIEKQVAKVKKLSLEKAPKAKLGKEWDKLEKAINTLVSTNRKIVNYEQNNSVLLKNALEKIDKLTKAISSGSKGFEDTKSSLAHERLGQLNKKIRSKFTDEDLELMERGLEKIKSPETKAEIDKIEAQLSLLEKKHDELKKSGKHEPAALRKLEGMINSSKTHLKKLKG